MTRLELFNYVKALYPVYWVGQKKGICESPYVVIKYKNQVKSIDNSKAGWQYVDLMVYVPWDSINPIDDILEDLKNSLQHLAEFTGAITPDYLDEDVKAIMRSIEFRMPKVIEIID